MLNLEIEKLKGRNSLHSLLLGGFHDAEKERKLRITGDQNHYVENVGTHSGVEEIVCLVCLMVWR